MLWEKKKKPPPPPPKKQTNKQRTPSYLYKTWKFLIQWLHISFSRLLEDREIEHNIRAATYEDPRGHSCRTCAILSPAPPDRHTNKTRRPRTGFSALCPEWPAFQCTTAVPRCSLEAKNTIPDGFVSIILLDNSSSICFRIRGNLVGNLSSYN